MIQKVPKKSKLSSSIYYLLKVKIRCFSFSKRANTSAMLIPLMNNEERHLIGIRYKENDNADAFHGTTLFTRADKVQTMDRDTFAGVL